MHSILSKSARMPFHTDLREVLRAIGPRQLEFEWLLSSFEFLGYPEDESVPPPFEHCGAQWLSGAELTRIVERYALQFIWASFLGFPPDRRAEVERTNFDPDPSRSSLWNPEPDLAHPAAEIEIVAWDSGCTLLFARDASIGRAFRHHFPEATDLAEFNRDMAARRGGT